MEKPLQTVFSKKPRNVRFMSEVCMNAGIVWKCKHVLYMKCVYMYTNHRDCSQFFTTGAAVTSDKQTVSSQSLSTPTVDRHSEP